jgi:predicted metal-binding membrane protein
VRGADGIHLHGLAALVGVGYFVIWAVLGAAAYAAGAAAPNALSAWQHGLRLGVRCSLCCGSLMLALLAIGMMDLAAMAAVTVAISAERLAPAPVRVARVAGVAIVVVGVLTIARV